MRLRHALLALVTSNEVVYSCTISRAKRRVGIQFNINVATTALNYDVALRSVIWLLLGETVSDGDSSEEYCTQLVTKDVTKGKRERRAKLKTLVFLFLPSPARLSYDCTQFVLQYRCSYTSQASQDKGKVSS